ncbi:PH domain-containing protein [Psychrobacillus psychrodurans]|uniref:PH domain-containing protein n=1 Tax=Psychrobacillus psychrodurans TaxID=126157 RepID=UPI001F4D8F74|nr:PH domain-containing protein [Psychrobacillus psychrodurans]MCK1999360.1 PH domain-containing protein [Psychrobacillus psychrodurans]
MTFRSKRDRTFIILLVVALIIIAFATLWPVVYELFFTKNPEYPAIWIMTAMFLIITGMLLWIFIDIQYTFYDDYLYVKGGPFRSKIRYEDITKVNKTSNILVGYRILSSKDALEVNYKHSLMGSIIISPDNQEQFVKVLIEKAAHINHGKA